MTSLRLINGATLALILAAALALGILATLRPALDRWEDGSGFAGLRSADCQLGIAWGAGDSPGDGPRIRIACKEATR